MAWIRNTGTNFTKGRRKQILTFLPLPCRHKQFMKTTPKISSRGTTHTHSKRTETSKLERMPIPPGGGGLADRLSQSCPPRHIILFPIQKTDQEKWEAKQDKLFAFRPVLGFELIKTLYLRWNVDEENMCDVAKFSAKNWFCEKLMKLKLCQRPWSLF
jgi:hypothetical protein